MTQKPPCFYTGAHKTKLVITEVCECCGQSTPKGVTSRVALGCVPVALWMLVALVVAALVL